MKTENKAKEITIRSKAMMIAMRKKYKFNQWPFFYPEEMLRPYWEERRLKWKTFVIVGSKNTGKTTNIIEYARERAIANRHDKIGRFVIVRRTGKEREAYWHRGASEGEWWPNCVCKKDEIFWIDPVTSEEFLIAKLESISGSGLGRGQEYVGFDTVIFDDFIGLQGERRISGFTERLIPLVSNYCRKNLNNSLLIMIGNNDRLDAEWLTENDVQIPEAGGCYLLDGADSELKTVVYVEGVNTKQGIISKHLKDFKNTPLAWAPRMALNYLYSNQCMVTDENVIDLKRWLWPKERKAGYQFVIANKYCKIEQGILRPIHSNNKVKIYHQPEEAIKMWLCHVVPVSEIDRSKPVYALTYQDKLMAYGRISSLSDTLGEWLWDIFDNHLLGFTNPVIKEALIKGCSKWVTKAYILGIKM